MPQYDIFISYRRKDQRRFAANLRDSLDKHFYRPVAFLDQSAILSGTEWKERINEALSQCKLMIVVIGHYMKDHERISGEVDYVVLEVTEALRRNCVVLPVCCDGAGIAELVGLDERLQRLNDFQSCHVDTVDDNGFKKIIEHAETHLENLRVQDFAAGAVDSIASGHRLLGSLKRANAQIGRIAWSPRTPHIICPSYDGTARIWDVLHKDVERTIHLGGERVYSSGWSPCGTVIAIGLHRGGIRLVDRTTFDETSCDGKPDAVYDLSWSPCSMMLAAACGNTIRLWDRDGKELRRSIQHSERYYSVEWSPSGKQLVSTSEAGVVSVWSADDLQINWQQELPAPLWDASWAPDETSIVVGMDSGISTVFDARRGIEVTQLGPFRGKVNSVAFSPDGAILALKSTETFGQLAFFCTKRWSQLCALDSWDGGKWNHRIAFHSVLPLLATIGPPLDASRQSNAVNSAIHVWLLVGQRHLRQIA